MKGKMKTATIEVLEENERVLGSKTTGQYMIRYYEDGVVIGGSFSRIKRAAEVKARDWEEQDIMEYDENE